LKPNLSFAQLDKTRTEAERHRMRAEDGGSQATVAAALQDRIAGGAEELKEPMRTPIDRVKVELAASARPVTKGRPEGWGNAAAVESVETHKPLFPLSHRRLGISPTARDSHIPTARLRGPGKVENQKASDRPYATA
jgi:hypothetical protein